MENENATFLKLDIKFDADLFIKELNSAIKKNCNKLDGWANIGLDCPNIKSFITKQFKAKKFYRIKANLLKPKTLIPKNSDSRRKWLGLTEHYPYTDKNPYKTLYIWLALEWPEATIFNCREHSLNIKKGDAFLMTFGKTHEVYNGSKKYVQEL